MIVTIYTYPESLWCDVKMNQWKFHNALTFFRLITVLKLHIAHEKQVALLSEYGHLKQYVIEIFLTSGSAT